MFPAGTLQTVGAGGWGEGGGFSTTTAGLHSVQWRLDLVLVSLCGWGRMC